MMSFNFAVGWESPVTTLLLIGPMVAAIPAPQRYVSLAN